jgi:hypothetical protein
MIGLLRGGVTSNLDRDLWTCSSDPSGYTMREVPMRRALLTLTLAVLALTLVPGVAVARTEPNRDRAFTVGEVSFVASPTSFSFDAKADDPFGVAAKGRFFISDFPGPPYSGRVTCLNVVGNVAIIGGVTSGPGFFPEGTSVRFSVADNGDSGDTASGFSVVPGGLPPDDQLVLCLTPSPPPGALVDGNIVVQDAPCDEIKDKPGFEKDKCKS